MQNEKFRLVNFAKFFKPYIGLIGVGFVFLIGAKVAATIEPIYLQKIIDGLAAKEALRTIIIFLVIGIALQIVDNFGQLIRDYFMSPVIMGVTRDIEIAVFDRLLKLQVSYHADQKAGTAARAVARGTRAISFVLDFSISQLLPPIFELAFVTFVLLKLFTWQYAVVTVITIVIYTIFTIWGTEKRQKYRTLGNEQDDQSTGILVESVSHIDTVKYFNAGNILFDMFKKIKNVWFKYLVKNNRMFAAVYSAQGIILLAGLSVILTLAIFQTYDGLMTAGSLVLVSTYLIRLSIPISTLGFVYGQFKNSFADLEAMNSILSQKETIIEPSKPIKPKRKLGRIKFNNVYFRYEDAKTPVFSDLNIEISPGTKVAFVGPSGAGKSTIVKLLFRLFDVSSGSIEIDGVDIKKLSATSRRELLAIVPQEPALFNESVADNIKFGKPTATMREIIFAARAAQIHDFIISLPKGYDTKVGERGIKVSGGQRQRIAIARAIIKNPKILVFDEATSSLDSKNESAILKTLDKVAKRRTTITIAHRLSTIVGSNVIYVIKNNRIVEHGNHAKLLKASGVYAKMWRAQSKSNQK